jgi:hypothetical protein
MRDAFVAIGGLVRLWIALASIIMVGWFFWELSQLVNRLLT